MSPEWNDQSIFEQDAWAINKGMALMLSAGALEGRRSCARV